MKQKITLLFLLFSLFILLHIPASFSVSKEVGMILKLDNSPPSVTVISPIPEMYNHEDVCLQLLVIEPYSEIDRILYELDGNPLIAITSDTTINVSEGQHTIRIYANDTLGFLNDSQQVVFGVDKSIPDIIQLPVYYNGNTTDFSSLTKLQQQSVQDMTLEVAQFGKIVFNDVIDLTDDGRFTCNPRKTIDLVDTIIGYNKISINTTGLPQLNKPATLFLYNLTFVNPKILKDNQDCLASICDTINYFDGTLEFTVTEFSGYSAVESAFTASGSTSSLGSGSGGGGKPVKYAPTAEEKCLERWICTEWSGCTNKKQTITCYDYNNCGTSDAMPELERNCESRLESSEKPAQLEKSSKLQDIAGTIVLLMALVYLVINKLAEKHMKITKVKSLASENKSLKEILIYGRKNKLNLREIKLYYVAYKGESYIKRGYSFGRVEKIFLKEGLTRDIIYIALGKIAKRG